MWSYKSEIIPKDPSWYASGKPIGKIVGPSELVLIYLLYSVTWHGTLCVVGIEYIVNEWMN